MLLKKSRNFANLEIKLVVQELSVRLALRFLDLFDERDYACLEIRKQSAEPIHSHATLKGVQADL
jgi:hypothetical protein